MHTPIITDFVKLVIIYQKYGISLSCREPKKAFCGIKKSYDLVILKADIIFFSCYTVLFKENIQDKEHYQRKHHKNMTKCPIENAAFKL